MKPTVSIVIPVYNGETYIKECMDSILGQTFHDFEVIAVDDRSTDHSLDLLRKYADKDARVRVLENPSHDMIHALNYGIKQSKGDYIARMDIDDMMCPHRIERQIEVMESHPEVAVCASWMKTFGLKEQTCGGGQEAVLHPLFHLLRGNFIAHPTTMLRTSFLRCHKLRYRKYPYAEDYKLWMDIALHGGRFWIIPEVLLRYRLSDRQVSCRKRDVQTRTSNKIRNEILNLLLEQNDFPDEYIHVILTYLGKYNQKGYVSDSTIFNLCAEILLSFHGKNDEDKLI